MINSRTRTLQLFISVMVFLSLSACQKAYYSTMEKFGVHKRDIMVDRVSEARDSQEEAKEQFASALERFSAVLDFKGGTLEEKYKKVKAELDRSEKKAEDVHKRIAAVEDVSEALFDEWEDELGQYTSPTLRQSSKKQLDQTKREYAKLIAAMKKAESKIDPVLRPLRDQVLYLKHNLNARAISSLQSELVQIETDVTVLIKEMEASIREADSFIRTLEK